MVTKMPKRSNTMSALIDGFLITSFVYILIWGVCLAFETVALPLQGQISENINKTGKQKSIYRGAKS